MGVLLDLNEHTLAFYRYMTTEYLYRPIIVAGLIRIYICKAKTFPHVSLYFKCDRQECNVFTYMPCHFSCHWPICTFFFFCNRQEFFYSFQCLDLHSEFNLLINNVTGKNLILSLLIGIEFYY